LLLDEIVGLVGPFDFVSSGFRRAAVADGPARD